MRSLTELLAKLQSETLEDDEETLLFEALAEANATYEDALVDPAVNRMIDRVAQHLDESDK